MRLTLSLFGPFVATLDGEELKIRSRRSQAMLAMLAVARRGTLSRDRLAAILWPDRPEDQARASLRQELSTLRAALGRDKGMVTADATSVRLAPDMVRLDMDGAGTAEFLDGLDLRSEPFDEWRRAEATRLAAPATAAGDGPTADASMQGIFANPSVLILAFDPAGPEMEDVAFATGLVVDLRTSLSLWRWFPVIGPDAVGWRTDHDANLRDIAASVAAAYVLGGTVRRAGERIRVSVSLAEATTGHVAWADTFEGSMSDIFEMQETISRSIVARVAPEVGRAEAARVARRRPSDMTAWQLLAQTDELERTGGEGYGSRESNAAQVPLLEEATRLEPDYARAWARLGRYSFRAAMLGWVDDRDAALDAALHLSGRAVKLDPAEWEAQAYRALALVFGRHAFGAGRFHALEAVRLNPSSPLARHVAGCVLEWLGEPEAALSHLETVFQLNPSYPNRAAVLGDMTTCQLLAGQVEAAVATARQLRDIAPDYNRGLQRVAVTLGRAGLREEAAASLDAVLALQPQFDAAYVRGTYPYAEPRHVDVIMDGLRRAGWTG